MENDRGRAYSKQARLKQIILTPTHLGLRVFECLGFRVFRV